MWGLLTFLGIIALNVAITLLAALTVAPWQNVMFAGAAFGLAIVLFWAERVLSGLDKTNELLTQLVAQSGTTEVATSADAIPIAEPVVEADISSADGFTADD